jgi:hypothetical protein
MVPRVESSGGGYVERFGATGNAVVWRKLLKGLVGACGFEPQTPTVSR